MTEKLKNYLGWVIIISLLILVGAAWRYVSAYSRSIQPSSFRSFAVNGEGKVVIVPDIAQFTFSVITEGGADIGKLQTDNTAKVNQAVSFLKGKGVEAKDIKTENYNLSPRYQTSNCGYRVDGLVQTCPPPVIVGYSINQSVAVKIRKDDFSKIGAILAGVVESGVNNVSQLNFTIDDPIAAENQARAQAISEAKDKAKSVARAAGFSLGQLLGIDEGYNSIPKIYTLGADIGRGGAMPESAPAPTIEPGSQEVRVSVTLRYEID